MKKKSFHETQTQSLLTKLKVAKAVDDIDHLLDHYNPMNFIEHFSALASNRNLTNTQIFAKAQINRVYGYQILKGIRIPSRDKVIQFSFGLSLGLDETQELLNVAGYKELYPKFKRDCYIIHSIIKEQHLIHVNQLLFDKGFRILE